MASVICPSCLRTFPNVVAQQMHTLDGCAGTELFTGTGEPTHSPVPPKTRRSSRQSLKTDKIVQYWEGEKQDQAKRRKKSNVVVEPIDVATVSDSGIIIRHNVDNIDIADMALGSSTTVPHLALKENENETAVNEKTMEITKEKSVKTVEDHVAVDVNEVVTAMLSQGNSLNVCPLLACAAEKTLHLNFDLEPLLTFITSCSVC